MVNCELMSVTFFLVAKVENIVQSELIMKDFFIWYVGGEFGLQE